MSLRVAAPAAAAAQNPLYGNDLSFDTSVRTVTPAVSAAVSRDARGADRAKRTACVVLDVAGSATSGPSGQHAVSSEPLRSRSGRASRCQQRFVVQGRSASGGHTGRSVPFMHASQRSSSVSCASLSAPLLLVLGVLGVGRCMALNVARRRQRSRWLCAGAGRPRGCGEVMKLELMMSHNLEASPRVRGPAPAVRSSCSSVDSGSGSVRSGL